MKKMFTLTALALLFAVLTAHSQNKKQPVLIEEFSNTGCGPCASYSPVLDSVVSYRLGDVVSVKYHGYYPDKADVFYNNLKDDMNKRITFYDVNAYPTTVINGSVVGTSFGAGYLNSLIDEKTRTEDAFDIELTADVNNHNLHIKTVVTPNRDVDNSNLRLTVVVIEEYYENAAAFKNGETHVRNITRKMLPNASGYNLGAQLTKGTAYTYEADWAITDFGDENQLGVVAFLQDISTKEVVATAYVPHKANGTDELCLMNVEYTPDNICVPNYYGTVTFRNQGGNKITSAKLNVCVNGTTKQYGWSGELDYLDRAVMAFADFTDFSLSTASNTNTAEIWLSDINGTDKESNRMALNFSNSVTAENSVLLRIYTDNKPEETTWKVFNSAGEVVAEGGPYTEARKFYMESLNLTIDDCYTLEFYDKGGDGIVGTNGNGYFQMFQVTSDGKRKNIKQGDYDGDVYSVDFRLHNADPSAGINNVENDDIDASTPVNIYNVQGQAIGKTTAERIDNGSLSNAIRGVSVLKYGGKADKTRKVITK